MREARGLTALEARGADAWRKNVHDNGHQAGRILRDSQYIAG